MTEYIEQTIKVSLEVRRCAGCNLYFAFESVCGWRCGNCWYDTANERDAEIKRLERANAALRGAMKRVARRKGKGRR